MTRYWNQEKFEGLEAIATQAEGQPHLQAFARSCRFKATGLRRQAQAALDEFIAEALALDPGIRRQLIDERGLATAGCADQRRNPQVHHLIPHPLAKRLVEPVLAGWLRDAPDDAAVHRWLGILHKDRAALRTAVALDADEVLARDYLLRELINSVAFATHHLPDGELVCEIAFVQECLAEAAGLLVQLPHSEGKPRFAGALAQQRQLVEDFLAWSEQPEGVAFEQWCERRQREYIWGVYYAFD